MSRGLHRVKRERTHELLSVSKAVVLGDYREGGFLPALLNPLLGSVLGGLTGKLLT